MPRNPIPIMFGGPSAVLFQICIFCRQKQLRRTCQLCVLGGGIDEFNATWGGVFWMAVPLSGQFSHFFPVHESLFSGICPRWSPFRGRMNLGYQAPARCGDHATSLGMVTKDGVGPNKASTFLWLPPSLSQKHRIAPPAVSMTFKHGVIAQNKGVMAVMDPFLKGHGDSQLRSAEEVRSLQPPGCDHCGALGRVAIAQEDVLGSVRCGVSIRGSIRLRKDPVAL